MTISGGKRIIFFSRDLKIGGMEKALVILLNSLANKGHDVTLVLTNKTGELLNQLSPQIKIEEYRVCESKFLLLRKAFNFCNRTIWKIKNKNKYDFSCNYATYMTIGSVLALIASKNSSLYVHSDYYNFFKKDEEKTRAFFEEQRISQMKNLIFVSNEAVTPISKIFPEQTKKFVVISNLVEYENIDKLSNERIPEQKPEKQLIVFVGRLEEESKKLSRLIEAFDKVCKNSSDFELWIIGGGNAFSLCQNLISKYHLEEHVKMLGEKLNPYPYMKMSDCVIITSDFEGFPVVYNECVVLKKPIITTIPVSDDFFDIKDFSVLTDKNAEAIFKAIIDKKYLSIESKAIDFKTINEKRISKIENLF